MITAAMGLDPMHQPDRAAVNGGTDHSEDFKTNSAKDLLGFIATARTKVIVEDAGGNRFVLVPEADFRALQEFAELNGHADTSSSEQRRGDARRHARVVRLTSREQQVLQLATEGRPGPAMAAELGLAPNTVAQHLAAVRRKYGVSSTAAAAVMAREAGLIT